MNTGTFDVFENPRNEDVFAVGDRVDFNFNAIEVFVDKNWVFGLTSSNDDLHVFLNVVVAKSDDHVLPAEYVAWAHKHWITDFIGNTQSFFFSEDGMTSRTFDFKFAQQIIETFAVFSSVDAIGRGADDFYTISSEIGSKFNGCLTTIGNNNADWLFKIDDWFYIFPGNWFEVEAVCGVKVCGNCFWVVVNDNDFVAKFFESPDRVNAGIVELDPLTDANWARTKYDDTLFRGFFDGFKGFVFSAFFRGVEYGVEIRGFGGELSSAGINHFVNRCHMRRQWVTT